MLLSQQEERHLFEKNVQAALQETSDDLQRTLQLVIYLFSLLNLMILYIKGKKELQEESQNLIVRWKQQKQNLTLDSFDFQLLVFVSNMSIYKTNS